MSEETFQEILQKSGYNWELYLENAEGDSYLNKEGFSVTKDRQGKIIDADNTLKLPDYLKV